ncbi:MAG: hypothetical protein AVDCRST_MAG49-3762 [uncultured Thermomicrobiales bacterium]|uniref:HTH tetR-type domain-containing protein n=1 Tax=uncultured Thermomicrobiales bacterium TaxID=1645740 RepID=A0A6J4V8K3_9BACT|nr:MAG: hypothetical protein AVDCRST_MAG49-3762 [uncultured Thermomicrobiales bacterium]
MSRESAKPHPEEGQTAPSAAAVRRARIRRETQAMILEAAGKLLAEGGVDDFSLRGVARAVGYSPAALYEYFPSKEALLDTLYFEGRGGLGDRMRAALATLPEDVSTADAMRALGHAYRSYAFENRELFLLVFSGGHAGGVAKPAADGEPIPDGVALDGRQDPTSSAAGTDDKTAFDLLVDTCARGVARGEMASRSPLVLAMAAWSTVHGFVMIELSGAMGAIPPPGGEHGAAAQLWMTDLFEATVEIAAVGFLRREPPSS